jgi:bifunctional DNA-binding transcriptional regulator/antitoxin component of YhaV-PrlF toxin-antitoxin module
VKFAVYVRKEGRVTVPRAVGVALNIKEGNYVKCKIEQLYGYVMGMFAEKRVPLVRNDIVRVKVVERVRSRRLGEVLFSVLKKLEESIESQVGCLMREVGGNLAKKLSKIAQSWGNEFAVNWAEDSGFVRYLTITYMNTQQ